MGQRLMGGEGKRVEETTNLDGVTTATTGSKIDCRWYKRVAWYLTSASNTGAVTFTIQASIDGTNWFDVQTKTYTATNGSVVYHYGYNSYYPYMRCKTSTQSNSTATAYVVARS